MKIGDWVKAPRKYADQGQGVVKKIRGKTATVRWADNSLTTEKLSDLTCVEVKPLLSPFEDLMDLCACYPPSKWRATITKHLRGVPNAHVRPLLAEVTEALLKASLRNDLTNEALNALKVAVHGTIGDVDHGVNQMSTIQVRTRAFKEEEEG